MTQGDKPTDITELYERVASLEVQMSRCMDLMNMLSATLKLYGMELHALKTGKGGGQAPILNRIIPEAPK